MSAEDRRQAKKLNQLKPKVNETYKEYKTTFTNFEFFDDEDVVVKTYLCLRIAKAKGHMSLIKKHNKLRLERRSHGDTKIFFKNAVKATIQTLSGQR